MPKFNENAALLFKKCIDAGIESPNELANIMGNASIETAGFRTMHERLIYTSVERINHEVPSSSLRYANEEIQAAVDSRDPSQIAKILYEDRADLGNSSPGDGYRFHGRGYFQFTGRTNYKKFGDKYGVDLVTDPERAADPEIAASLAIAYWKERVPARFREDAGHAGFIINGGGNGMEERVAQSGRWKEVITPELIDRVKDGSIDLVKLNGMGTDDRTNRHGKSADHPAVAHSLRQGDHGTRVADLQIKLDQLGLAGDHNQHLVNRNNHFGPLTDHAVRSFQREQHLLEDGIAGPATLKALEAKLLEKTKESPALTFTDPTHSGHALYRQTFDAVCRLDAQFGRTPDQRSENLAGMLTVAAQERGLHQINEVRLSDDASRAVAVCGEPGSLIKLYAAVDMMQAINTPLQQSSSLWNTELDKARVSAQENPSLQLHRQNAPSFSR
jgi:putative chitinase